MAKKAAAMEGADFVALILEGGDPNGVNKSVDELLAVVKEVADAIDAPLVVEGCKNVEKDAELLPKVAEALQGRNVLIILEIVATASGCLKMTASDPAARSAAAVITSISIPRSSSGPHSGISFSE